MAVIGIIGCGFIGCHLIDTFCKKFEVYGFDISEKRIKLIQQHYPECVHFRSLARFSEINKCDLICICVPTPVDDNKLNDVFLRSAVGTVQKYIRQEPKVPVVIESSVSIGLTRILLRSLYEQGHRVGMSPERVSPGDMTTKACHIPKIVSGMDVTSLNSIIDVYSEVFDTVVPVSSLETAEMCKLYENCFRMINISYVNEISDACIKHGIDCNEMIKASTTKGFGFMPFYPSLYVGGSCIPNNCKVLLDKCDNLTVLRTATEANEHRPLLKAHEIVRTYANANNFLIIGIGFKIGESVLENSPGLKLARVLKKHYEKNVTVFDPLVEQDAQCEFEFADVTDLKCDIVVISVKQHGIDFDALRNQCEQRNIPIICF